MKNKIPIIAVAPMMGYTDRHMRYFLRLIAPNIQLYTEMITAQALVKGNALHLLKFNPKEHPIVLQLGGSDPSLLQQAAVIGAHHGYDEINLNVGCPSPRVKAGQFGACLMYQPELVAACVEKMRASVTIPITVKCRIGVDHHDSYEALYSFVEKNAEAGCKTFVIHARKAWLKGLSPKENREIPPLHYDVVYRLKQDFPELTIIINGGITALSQVESHLEKVDGVMIGRSACANPYLLAEIQNALFAHQPSPSRHEVVQQFAPYLEEQMQNQVKFAILMRPLLGLFQGQRGAANWRRYLSKDAHCAQAGLPILETALKIMS